MGWNSQINSQLKYIVVVTGGLAAYIIRSLLVYVCCVARNQIPVLFRALQQTYKQSLKFFLLRHVCKMESKISNCESNA
jgi:hypothetical protein